MAFTETNRATRQNITNLSDQLARAKGQTSSILAGQNEADKDRKFQSREASKARTADLLKTAGTIGGNYLSNLGLQKDAQEADITAYSEGGHMYEFQKAIAEWQGKNATDLADLKHELEKDMIEFTHRKGGPVEDFNKRAEGRASGSRIAELEARFALQEQELETKYGFDKLLQGIISQDNRELVEAQAQNAMDLAAKKQEYFATNQDDAQAHDKAMAVDERKARADLSTQNYKESRKLAELGADLNETAAGNAENRDRNAYRIDAEGNPVGYKAVYAKASAGWPAMAQKAAELWFLEELMKNPDLLAMYQQIANPSADATGPMQFSPSDYLDLEFQRFAEQAAEQGIEPGEEGFRAYMKGKLELDRGFLSSQDQGELLFSGIEDGLDAYITWRFSEQNANPTAAGDGPVSRTISRFVVPMTNTVKDASANIFQPKTAEEMEGMGFGQRQWQEFLNNFYSLFGGKIE